MAITLATGTRIAIASALGTSRTFTSASNATETVLSFAADPQLAVGDIFYVEDSGWDFLKGIVARVKAASGTGPYLVTLESIDTSSTARFPAGEGAGSGKEVTTWTSIPLIRDASIDGGELQFIDVPELAKFVTGRLPSEQTGITIGMPVYFEATPGAGITAAIAAQAGGTPVPIRISHTSGDLIYAAGYWSVRRMPSLSRGSARESDLSCALLPVNPTIYAS